MVMTGMIPVYVACLAGVHLQTSDSVQLGGYLLEQVITKLWQKLATIRSKDVAELVVDDPTQDDGMSKETCNLLLVLCYLYNLGVAHCSLMYEIIRNFIDHFTETDIELLLLTLSHCGHALRADDPSALKEIVLLVQKKALATQKGGETQSSRIEYMISAMTDLKNNKKRRQDYAFGEKTVKLRKLVGRIKSTVAANGTVRSSDACLRITLQDILHAESKGRWWKVGACWVGNQYNRKGDDYESNKEEGAPTAKKADFDLEEEEMLKLASKHRMNTDMRRSIFCIIMGSADCDDAFEKLVRAGMLKNRTERDTVRVLTECCGNEKSFNPFYSHLAARICDYQPQCKFTFQLSFWDTFKQFDELKLRKVANLAKLLFHLVAVHKSLRMNILKVIDMSPDTMSESASIFLTIFFSSLFDYFDDPADMIPLLPHIRQDSAAGSVVESAEDNGDALRESFSVFFLHVLKSSPKNKKNSKFRANFKAAVKACETDRLY
jgi:nucleolar MIF4G domain-containing protein 1